MGFRGSPVRIRPSRLGKDRFGRELAGAVFSRCSPLARATNTFANTLRQIQLHDKRRTTDYRGMEQHPLSPGDLPAQWRERAERLRRYSVPASNAYEDAANELEQVLRELGEESLNLVEAASESGFSQDHLGSLVRRGEIPNAGRIHAPRIRRADLPIKSANSPGRPPTRRKTPAAEEITSIANKLRR